MGTFSLFIGLGAVAVALYGYARWQARSEYGLRAVTEFRWRWDRLFSGKLRRGEISKAAYAASFFRRRRFILKWILAPVTAVWVAACLTGAILSLTAR